MMKKKIKFLSNLEWMKIHHPECCSDHCYGGVAGCPFDYGLQEYCSDLRCLTQHEQTNKLLCKICWNFSFAKRNGKYIAKVVEI
jgi:hypothetical protein